MMEAAPVHAQVIATPHADVMLANLARGTQVAGRWCGSERLSWRAMARRLPDRIRTVPWLLLLRGAQLVWTHLQDDLTAQDRARLGRLLRVPPHRMTPADRAELRRIAAKVDLRGLGRDFTDLRKGLR